MIQSVNSSPGNPGVSLFRISDGQYLTTPTNFGDGTSQSPISMKRGNVVMHELKENFLRTEGNNGRGMDYLDSHTQAGQTTKTGTRQLNKGYKLAGEDGNPQVKTKGDNSGIFKPSK